MSEARAGHDTGKRPTLPPNWFIRFAWAFHRAVFRWTGGRRGLWKATPKNWGTFRLHTVGRTSGKERIAILGYHEDGPNIVTVAMNGWMEGDPAWWLNLQANPDATVEIGGVAREVRGRLASEQEAEEGWRRFVAASAQYTEYRSATSRQIPIIILEPRQESGQRNVPKEPPPDP